MRQMQYPSTRYGSAPELKDTAGTVTALLALVAISVGSVLAGGDFLEKHEIPKYHPPTKENCHMVSEALSEEIDLFRLKGHQANFLRECINQGHLSGLQMSDIPNPRKMKLREAERKGQERDDPFLYLHSSVEREVIVDPDGTYRLREEESPDAITRTLRAVFGD